MTQLSVASVCFFSGFTLALVTSNTVRQFPNMGFHLGSACVQFLSFLKWVSSPGAEKRRILLRYDSPIPFPSLLYSLCLFLPCALHLLLSSQPLRNTAHLHRFHNIMPTQTKLCQTVEMIFKHCPFQLSSSNYEACVTRPAQHSLLWLGSVRLSSIKPSQYP